ncbi:MAG: hypothetical protein Q9221_005587 [Calogaya cf. arnoldii]
MGPESVTSGSWTFKWRWSNLVPITIDNVEANARDSRYPAAGASYIRMPQQLPNKVSGNKYDWIGATGIRALAWAGGSWIASRDSSRVTKRQESWNTAPKPPAPENWQISMSEGIWGGGKVYYTSPPASRLPDLMEVDGKNYSDGGRGDLRYQSDDGVILNLTALVEEMEAYSNEP